MQAENKTGGTGMGKEYITGEEREKCIKVKDAFAELYENQEIMVADAGRFGFVKLQYYLERGGFDTVETYTDSRELFECLWMEWRDMQIDRIREEMNIEEVSYDEVFEELPEETKKKYAAKKHEFAEKSGIVL